MLKILEKRIASEVNLIELNSTELNTSEPFQMNSIKPNLIIQFIFSNSNVYTNLSTTLLLTLPDSFPSKN